MKTWSAFDLLPDAVLVASREGLILYANPAAESLFGHPATKIAGMRLLELLPEYPGHSQTSPRPSAEATPTQRVSRPNPNQSGLHKDGSRILLSISLHTLEDGQQILSIRRQADQEQQEETLRMGALNAAANGIVLSDRDGKIIWVNPAFTAITGFTAAEAIGKTTRLLKSGLHDPAFYQDLWQTVLSGKIWHGEIVNRRKDGSTYFEEQTITPVLDRGGKITHFIAVKQDVSERKQSQQLIVRRESHLAAVVETQHMLLAAEGKNLPMDEILILLGSIFHASRVYLVENRYDLDEQMYMQRQFEWCAAGIRPLKEELNQHKLYYREVIPNWRTLLSQGKMIAGILADFASEERRFMIVQDIQSILVFPLLVNGSFGGFLAFDDCLEPRQWQPAETSLMQVAATSIAMARDRLETEDHLTSAYGELAQRLVELSTLNEIIQTVATVTDLQQALELVATKMCLLFDAVSCGIALLNAECDRLQVIVQYRRDNEIENVVGKVIPLQDNPASQQVIEQLQSLVIQDAQNNPQVASAHGLMRAQGIHSILLTPLLSRGQVLGTIGLDLDVPEREFSFSEVRLAETIAAQVAGAIENGRLFQEAQQARAVAEESNQAKSAFLASMSHELRTPLNAILGFTQLMERSSNLSATQRESLATIIRSGDHLLGLINDVLDLSKIEAGRVTLQETDFDLHYLLRGLEDMFALRAKTKGLLLRFETTPGTPRHIRSDEGKLRQILINILGNAVKFTSRGSITLSVSAENGESPTPPGQGIRERSVLNKIMLKFAIHDTGFGIAAEDQERIFEPFVQSTHGARAAEGTGLGLAISRQYARMLGGDITLQSRLGAGSTFFASVLVSKAATGELPAHQSLSRVIGLAPGQPPRRLMVAEDSDANRQLLVLLLSSVGFEVRGVEDGAQAVQVANEWQPHLIWMDIRMPVLDGLEATRQIKANAANPPVIIALTASAFRDDRSITLEAGCDEYLSKPYRESEIFDALSRHLGVRFLYENQADGDETAPGSEPISIASLALLPSGLLNRLGMAALEGDILSLETVISEIGKQHGALGHALMQLANQFEYDKIHSLVQETLLAGGRS